MTQYRTSDSRLAAFLMVNGCRFVGTEATTFKDEDRIYLTFEVDENQILDLKRQFFEDSAAPALSLLNAAKSVMHNIREARELLRDGR